MFNSMAKLQILLSYPPLPCSPCCPPFPCKTGDKFILILIDPTKTADGSGVIVSDIVSRTFNILTKKFDYVVCFDDSLLAQGQPTISQCDLDDQCCFNCQSKFAQGASTLLVETLEDDEEEVVNIDTTAGGTFSNVNVFNTVFNNPSIDKDIVIDVWQRFRAVVNMSVDQTYTHNIFQSIDAAPAVLFTTNPRKGKASFFGVDTWETTMVSFYTVLAGGSIAIETSQEIIVVNAAFGTTNWFSGSTDIRIIGRL